MFKSWNIPDIGLGRLAIISVDRDRPHAGIEAIEALFKALPDEHHTAEFVIAVPANAHVDDLENAFFHWISGCDPGRDVVRSGRRIGFDATTKIPGEDDRGGMPVRDFPPILEMDPDIVHRVTERWSEYGFEGPPPPSRNSPETVSEP